MIELSLVPVAVILGMATVTYATKAGGLWILDQIEVPDQTRDGLDALPGGIIVAILAPRLLRGGPFEWIAALVVLVVVHRTDSLLLALSAGLAAVLLLRYNL